ncbi:hypothetical protein [Butyrivibrio sp. AD3002]|uniref:hypothetical protein n=1 Tax=Butyrivibrio sp. AD3002 TaxID=1280670 RepID=UPI0003F54EE2|nr:hypothetical protein [Butyrivibrio sp. AD3002]
MSKQKPTEELIKALIACSENLIVVAESLKAYAEVPETKEKETTNEQPEPEKEVTAAPSETLTKPEVKVPTFEEVRKTLAGISSQDDGKYKSQIKDLVGKYSSTGTLKGVPEESYAALVAEAEAIINA